MNASDLRSKTESELKIELHNLLRERFNLYMQRGTGQLTRPDQIRKVRKDIARVHTVLNEKTGDAS
ncbi:MAG: 50S ribosomal protein L29 [Gammaproteobacteria bacterium]|jgi:large subunit ribosomal protein L29